MTYIKKLFFFSLTLLIIKLIVLPYVHEIDADAISRVYKSLQFEKNPHIIKSGNWPPIFFYIMGGALKIYNNQFFTPVFVNILFSILLLFPLFHLLKRLFDDKTSFLLCIFFSFSPIVFRMSMLAMSEISYLFFVILSLYVLSKGLIEKKTLMIVLAGFIMSVAGGIRYESWILGSLIILYIAYYKSIKEALLFSLTFVIIPVYWITSSFINTNDALNSFNWAIDLPAKNSIDSVDTFLRRIWWHPLSLMFAFGPIAFYFFIKEVKHYKTNRVSYLLSITLLIFFIIWIINSLRGSLLLQHRFIITFFLLSFPFIGFYFKKNPKNLNIKTLIFSLSAFFFAFIYSSKGARPIPRLLTKDAQKVSEIINNNVDYNSGLICDFWNWETTYYIPFSTNLPEHKKEIIDKYDDIVSVHLQIAALTKNNKNGVMLVKKKSTLYNILKKTEGKYRYSINQIRIDLETIFENESILCFKYSESN